MIFRYMEINTALSKICSALNWLRNEIFLQAWQQQEAALAYGSGYAGYWNNGFIIGFGLLWLTKDNALFFGRHGAII